MAPNVGSVDRPAAPIRWLGGATADAAVHTVWQQHRRVSAAGITVFSVISARQPLFSQDVRPVCTEERRRSASRSVKLAT
nr:hypothetical protein [Kibdelosporangium sp. MJ126-NF4]CTQ92794.1 hypothetical protein [Kibdelosporangium sp. MJ126-NF4]